MIGIIPRTKLAGEAAAEIPILVAGRRAGTISLNAEALRDALFQDSAKRILAPEALGGEGRTPLEGPRHATPQELMELTRANADAIAAATGVVEQLKEQAAADVWIVTLATDQLLRCSTAPVRSLTRAVKHLGLSVLDLPSVPQIVRNGFAAKHLEELRDLRQAIDRRIPLPKGRPRVSVASPVVERLRRRKAQIVQNVRRVKKTFRGRHGRNVNTWPLEDYQQAFKTDVVAPLMEIPPDKKRAATQEGAIPALAPSEVAVRLLKYVDHGSKISKTSIRQNTRRMRR